MNGAPERERTILPLPLFIDNASFVLEGRMQAGKSRIGQEHLHLPVLRLNGLTDDGTGVCAG